MSMKKFFFFILILQFTYLTTYAEELLPIDAVLVLDVSRSMATADPDRISRDAMHLFIEKLSEERDRVGIVAYAGNVERSIELQDTRHGQTTA
jgi:Mg-chelatase subunit ChlD